MNRDYKIYQPGEAQIIRLNLKDREFRQFKVLNDWFTNGLNEHVFRSLWFYFRTQFRTISLFPEIEDIQNFCTAFEKLFKIPNQPGVSDLLAEAFVDYFSENSDENKSELREWVREMYNLRSDYTHGKPVNYESLVFRSQRHIDVAKVVYCEAVNKMLDPDDHLAEFFGPQANRVLTPLFHSQTYFESAVKSLTADYGRSNSGKLSFDHFLNCTLEDLDSIRNVFSKYTIQSNKRSIQVTNAKRLKLALFVLLDLILHLSSEYNDPSYDKKFFTDVIPTLLNIKIEKFDENELESAYEVLHGIRDFQSTELDDKHNVISFRRELVFRDSMDIALLGSGSI